MHIDVNKHVFAAEHIFKILADTKRVGSAVLTSIAYEKFARHVVPCTLKAASGTQDTTSCHGSLAFAMSDPKFLWAGKGWLSRSGNRGRGWPGARGNNCGVTSGRRPIEGASFSGLLTRVEIGHIRIRAAGQAQATGVHCYQPIPRLSCITERRCGGGRVSCF